MSAKRALFKVYDTWRAWSEREGEAIGSGDWSAVGQCQAAKRGLQPLILQLTEQTQLECVKEGRDWFEVQCDIRATAGALMELETRNSERLSAKRRVLEETMAGLDGARRNLRRVQQSYAPGKEAAWQSYS